MKQFRSLLSYLSRPASNAGQFTVSVFFGFLPFFGCTLTLHKTDTSISEGPGASPPCGE